MYVAGRLSGCKLSEQHFFPISAFLCSCLSLWPPFPLCSAKTSISWKLSRADSPLNAWSASLVPKSNFRKQQLPVPEGRLDPSWLSGAASLLIVILQL